MVYQRYPSKNSWILKLDLETFKVKIFIFLNLQKNKRERREKEEREGEVILSRSIESSKKEVSIPYLQGGVRIKFNIFFCGSIF